MERKGSKNQRTREAKWNGMAEVREGRARKEQKKQGKETKRTKREARLKTKGKDMKKILGPRI